MYNVLKHACSVNETLRSRVVDIKESDSAIMDSWNIINEYDKKDLTQIAEKLNDR